jgi:hypothetical protein
MVRGLTVGLVCAVGAAIGLGYLYGSATACDCVGVNPDGPGFVGTVQEATPRSDGSSLVTFAVIEPSGRPDPAFAADSVQVRVWNSEYLDSGGRYLVTPFEGRADRWTAVVKPPTFACGCAGGIRLAGGGEVDTSVLRTACTSSWGIGLPLSAAFAAGAGAVYAARRRSQRGLRWAIGTTAFAAGVWIVVWAIGMWLLGQGRRPGVHFAAVWMLAPAAMAVMVGAFFLPPRPAKSGSP